jgi:myo-inositol 2-dehydrogenase/D-chiro-inositol 1-dehydrogenase
MQHLVDCVANDLQPLVAGDDGRAVMEIIFAAYASAGTGLRIEWPYEPPGDKTPQQVWGR